MTPYQLELVLCERDDDGRPVYDSPVERRGPRMTEERLFRLARELIGLPCYQINRLWHEHSEAERGRNAQRSD